MNSQSTALLRCWAEIDLGALERNLKTIQSALPEGIRYIAVVKADAYGHGMQPTVARLMQAGVDMFAVANVREAASIREIGGTGWPILILSAVLPEELSYLFDYQLIPTVSSLEEIERLEEEAVKRKAVLDIHVKIDTGMGRLGVWHTETEGLFDVLQAARHLKLKGVFTHFAHADGDPNFTELQRERFLAQLRKRHEIDTDELLIHADNSAGIGTFGRHGNFNAVRIGILQFGVSPYENSLFQGLRTEPVLSFKTKVSLVKLLPQGTYISYGRTHRLSRDSSVAILSAGYADGIPRELSNCGYALIDGRECPYLGRITMDQVIVDVTDLPSPPKVSDEVCLIGKQQDRDISVETFSGWANTIPWETLCSISKRVTRIYRKARIVS